MLTAFAILSDGLVYAAYLFLVAVGLTLIFGVMKILNVTHGSFYAFGAYGAATAVGIYVERGWPDAGGFLFMVLAGDGDRARDRLRARARRAAPGLRQDEVVIVLVTYAAFLILEDVIVLIWGPRSYARLPADGRRRQYRHRRSDAVELRHRLSSCSRRWSPSLSYWALKYTRYGRLLTVVIFDRETAAAFGINVTVVYTVTFIIGAMLGALGGAVMAPKISVTLGIGVEVIVLAFAVVAIGGMGSIEGALIGALIVGICRAAAVHLVPQLELFVIYAVMALVLVFRPHGLFTQAAAAEDHDHGNDRDPESADIGRARTCWRFIAVAAVAPALPPWLVSLATIAFANALVVLGLVILWRTGLVPFGQALFYAIGAYAVALLGRYTPAGATCFVLIAGRRGRRRHRRIPGRIPAGALSRHFLRDAQPRDVDDPLRRAGEDRDARLDRRLPRRGRDRSSATGRRGRALNLALFWLVLGLLARSPPCVVALYFRSVAGALAMPVRDNEIRVEFLGISVDRLIHLKLVISGDAGRPRRRAGGAGGAARRSATWRIGRPPAASCSSPFWPARARSRRPSSARWCSSWFARSPSICCPAPGSSSSARRCC